jgi:hypothetical protein
VKPSLRRERAQVRFLGASATFELRGACEALYVWLQKWALSMDASQLAYPKGLCFRPLSCCLVLFALGAVLSADAQSSTDASMALQWLLEDRKALVPWLKKVKVYIYDLHAAGFQPSDDVFQPDGQFCNDACPAQYQAPIWGADLCNHGYGHMIREQQTQDSLGAILTHLTLSRSSSTQIASDIALFTSLRRTFSL